MPSKPQLAPPIDLSDLEELDTLPDADPEDDADDISDAEIDDTPQTPVPFFTALSSEVDVQNDDIVRANEMVAKIQRGWLTALDVDDIKKMVDASIKVLHFRRQAMKMPYTKDSGAGPSDKDTFEDED